MIEVKNLSFSRGGKVLFENANLTIFPGNKVGMIGANGTGKSSFFALILKTELADQGDVTIPERLLVSHVEQEISNQQEKIVNYALQGDTKLFAVQQKIAQAEAEHNVDQLAQLYAQLENLDGYNAKHKAETLLSGLGFKPTQFDQPIASLSGGWQMRLNLARALMCPSDILLLDEPTNHLDLDTIIWLESFLSAYSGTLVIISHDREFLDSVTNKILAVSQRQLTLYNGNYSSYEKQLGEKNLQQQAVAKKTEQKMAELSRFITRFKAKASKAKQAQSRVKALNKLELIAPFQADKAIQFSFETPTKVPHSLAQLENVCFSYGDKQILKNINFNIFAEHRIGILGINGAGKSTLVKLLVGQNQPTSGHINRHKDINIGYFAQDFLQQLDTSSSPIEQYQQSFPDLSIQEIRNQLGIFGFSNDMAMQTIDTMSGGEKARLALSILVYQKPNLLILDEPTNHLDLEIRASLTYALQSFEGALLLVSHDRHLLESVCDEFCLMNNGTLQDFDGDLEDYRRFVLEKQRKKPEQTKTTDLKPNKKMSRQEAAEQRKKLKPLSNELKKLETNLEKYQRKNTEIENTLASSEIYQEQNKETLKKLLAEKAELTSNIETTETRWMEIEEELERLKAESE